MVEGNVALQVFAVATKVPRHLNYERNDDRSDDVTLVALVQGWPAASWRSLLARAEHQAGRLRRMAARFGRPADADPDGGRSRPASSSGGPGDPTLVGRPARDRGRPRARRRRRERSTGSTRPATGWSGSPTSSTTRSPARPTGVDQGGLTPAGRDLVAALERRRILVDLAHASEATIDDVLRIATRPVVASHTGVRAVADNGRNLTDDQLRRDRRDRRRDRDRVLADGLRRRRRRLDRPLDRPRRRGRRGGPRRARFGLRRGRPGAVHRGRDGAADRRAARPRPRSDPDRRGHGRLRGPAPARDAAARPDPTARRAESPDRARVRCPTIPPQRSGPSPGRRGGERESRQMDP